MNVYRAKLVALARRYGLRLGRRRPPTRPAAEPNRLLKAGPRLSPTGDYRFEPSGSLRRRDMAVRALEPEETVQVGTVRERTSRVSQVVTLIAVVVPPLGVVSAMGLLWGVGFHWIDVVLFLGLYTICAFGTTIGFHRYFTHKGFEARPSVKAPLAILGCMTMQGPLTQWVTDHRKHHALSDQPGDPHSPARRPRDRRARRRARLRPLPCRVDVLDEGDGARRRVRQGSLRGPAHPHDRPALPRLGRAHARDPVRDRLCGRRNLAGRRRGASSGAGSSGSSPTSTRRSA